MLYPCIVGIPHRGNAVLPATVGAQQVPTPVTHVERRIGNDVIGLQILVGIVQERSFVVPFDLRTVNSPDGQVHLAQAPGGLVTLLSVYGNVICSSSVFRYEFLRLHEHASRATARVKDPALEGLQHLDQKLYNTSGRIELSALLPLGKSKFPQEILKHMAEDISAPGFGIAKGDVAHQVYQFPEACGVKVLTCVNLGQDAFEGRIFLLYGIHSLVHDLADVDLLGLGEQQGPAGLRWYKKHIFRLVFIFILWIGSLGLFGIQPGV